jgi:hypothetical protein
MSKMFLLAYWYFLIIIHFLPIDFQCNHDCGLRVPYANEIHMLMHVEHWYGCIIYNLQKKHMPKLQKLLAYKWLTQKEMDADWEQKLGLAWGTFIIFLKQQLSIYPVIKLEVFYHQFSIS